jgi:16S rRNA (cytosine1402-N4)-methyltransferase
MTNEAIHIPVLTKEALAYLHPATGENVIDCTVGEAGHTQLILEKNGPDGKVLGIDLDVNQIANAKSNTEQFQDRVLLVNDSYAHISHIVDEYDIKPVRGILLDLGMSSWQLQKSQKGFSFMKDEPLDMRYYFENTLTAEKIVNEYSQLQIEKILTDYGQELYSRQIARQIVQERKSKRITSTFALKEIIERAVPKRYHKERIHYATRTFQALRIAVNGELDNLNTFLPQALSVLSNGGRLVIISFHSLEDRIVKNFFKQQEQEQKITILTKKPITASAIELLQNPAARSAKLRAIEKIS